MGKLFSKFRQSKAGRLSRNAMILGVIGLLVVGSLVWTGKLNTNSLKAGSTVDVGTTPSGGSGATTTPAASITSVDLTAQVAMTYTGEDRFDGSPITGTNVIRVTKAGQTTTTTSATYGTASIGDTIQFWFDNASVFDKPETVVIPAGGSYQMLIMGADNSTSPTLRLFNEVDVAATNTASPTTGTNITVGSGVDETVVLKIRAEDDKAFAPYGGVICVESSSTYFDGFDVKCDSGSEGYKGTGSAPTFYSLGNGNRAECFTFSKAIEDGAQETCDILLDTASGQNPAADTLDINIYPNQYFKEIDNSIGLGIENSKGTCKSSACNAGVRFNAGLS